VLLLLLLPPPLLLLLLLKMRIMDVVMLMVCVALVMVMVVFACCGGDAASKFAVSGSERHDGDGEILVSQKELCACDKDGIGFCSGCRCCGREPQGET
jgi:hypothetical protein